MLIALLLPGFLFALASQEDEAPVVVAPAPERVLDAVRIVPPLPMLPAEPIESVEVEIAEAGDGPHAAGAPDWPEVKIETSEGQVVKGRLTAAPEGRIGLRSDDFLEPLIIDPGTLATLSLDGNAAEPPDDEGALRFDLATGERVRGRLLAVHPDAWTVETRGMGTLDVPQHLIVGAEILGGGSVVFNGPAGLEGWRQLGRKEILWRATAERLVADAPGAHLVRDLGLNEGRVVTLEVSWTGQPKFRLGLGVGASDKKDKEAITVEPWGDTLVAWLDADEGFSFVELARGLEQDSSLTLRFRSDSRSVVFYDDSGEESGWLEAEELRGPCFSVFNDGKGLELLSLLALRDADAPPPGRLNGVEVLGFDAAGSAFELPGETVPLENVEGLDFVVQDSLLESAALPGDLRLGYSDGRLLEGAFVRVSDASIEVTPSWLGRPVACSLDGLESVTVVGGDDRARRRRSSKSFLQASAGEIAGTLEAIGPEGQIIWKPTIAESIATVDRKAVRRIVVNRTTAYFVSGRKFPHYMRLRSGDAFRCRLTLVSREEVRFQSPFGGERTIDPAEIKAVEFDVRKMDDFRTVFDEEEKDDNQNMRFFGGWNSGPPQQRDTDEGFDARSLTRALSLPRKYKRKPMENLILARTGDFLRTEVLSWTEEGAHYPGPFDQTRFIPNDRLAAIIWLDENEESETPVDDESSMMARVVMDERTHFRIALSALSEDRLNAVSPVLGELSLDLSYIHAIELAPELLAPGSPYEEWVLSPMKEPFPDGEPAPAVAARPRVGEVAPELTGVDLEGEELALADYAGKVVLLQFWGHW